MALKATIFKIDLQITDIDRHYYASHTHTLARHPSETNERMMARLCAFALHAAEALKFSKGLSTDDEPALWQKSLTDEIEVWIDVGQPDEKHIRKACSRAQNVFIYCYIGRSAGIWWEQTCPQLKRFNNLTVINLPETSIAELGNLVQRTMQLQCTIQDGQIWLSDPQTTVQIEPETWMHPA